MENKVVFYLHLNFIEIKIVMQGVSRCNIQQDFIICFSTLISSLRCVYL